MHLPPVERTKQLDLTPDVLERMTPPAPEVKANGSHPPRAMGAATTKWEPPAEFQAKLADAMSGDRASGVIVTPAPSSPRAAGVDTTIDDYSAPSSPVLPT